MRRYFQLLAILPAVVAVTVVSSPAAAMDDIADRVFGQIGFTYATPNLLDGRGFNNPSGVAIDTTIVPNRIYVADTDNNRVLGWADASAYANGAAADLVIGQPDFFTSDCNTGGRSATSLCAPHGVAVDEQGNLYVADQANHRVLMFGRPFNFGVAADMVFGQGDSFTSGVCNLGGVSATSLCNPEGVAVGAQGATSAMHLYIADTANSRVLMFAVPHDTTADLAFGQGPGALSFTTGACNLGGTSATSLCRPRAVTVDGAGNLYVADTDNSRVLVYATPLTTNVTADMVFGQGGSFATNACGNLAPTATSLCGPVGVAVDAASNLYVADGIARILAYTTPLTTDTTADLVFGQAGSFTSWTCNLGGRSATSLCNATGGVAVDGAGNLYAADPGITFFGSLNNRVLVYTAPLSTDATADRVLGQAGFEYGAANLIDSKGFDRPGGVAVDKSMVPNRVYVADNDNNRVLGWADASAYANGAAADLVIGQPNPFSSGCNTGGLSAASLCRPAGVAVDATGNLYVADFENSRVLMYATPFSTDTIADKVFGQGGSFTSGTCNLGGVSAASLCMPFAVTADGAGNLFVADENNNRILRYTMPLSTDTTADTVYGQGGSFTSNVCNLGGVSATTLCAPDGLAVDNSGNLYAADRGNSRVLVYLTLPAMDATADFVFGQAGSFTSSGCNFGGTSPAAGSLCFPYGVTVDGMGTVFVADTSNYRVLRYTAPLSTDVIADAVFGQGGSFTSAAGGCGVAATAASLCVPTSVAVDGSGRLYVTDDFNNRVLEYQPPILCGDGVIAGTEACDDSNAAASDGCDAFCAIESCYLCNGEPSVCTKPDADGDTQGDLCDACPADATNTCNPNQSASDVVGSDGGAVTTPDGSVTIDIPSNALTEDKAISITGGQADSNFGIDRNGRDALLVNIGPDDLSFDAPVTLTFSWPDADNDGKVDGFTSPVLREGKLQVWKDGAAITQTTGDPASAWCEHSSHKAPACNSACGGLECCCDETANTWIVQVTSLSEFFVGQAFEQIAVSPLKLVVVDKTALAGAAKTVFVAKDNAVTTGAGSDVADISARLDLAYGNAQAAGSFLLSAGENDGTAGWLVNKPTVAKYLNKTAPSGPTQGKVAVVKPGNLLKLAGKGLGDVPFDILGAGDPAGSVYAAYCVANGGSEYCHCAEFTSCTYKPIAADTGAKLTCKGGSPDPACLATAP